MIADADFAVESVKNDYGEDLLVQTSHGGAMDASRMWIQVKGTASLARYRRRNGQMSYSVPAKQVVRWARSADPVIVVLWDIQQALGYFAIIPDNVQSWDGVADAMPKSVKVMFTADRKFDVEGVTQLAWTTRMHRYRGLLLEATARVEHAEAMGGSDKPAHNMRALVVLDLLESLEIVEAKMGGYKLALGASEMYEAILRELVANHPHDTVDEMAQLVWGAAAMTFMRWAEEVTGNGVYGEHIFAVAEIMICLFSPPEDLKALAHNVVLAAPQ